METAANNEPGYPNFADAIISTILQHPVHSLIIFASGRGSNAQAIIDHFRKEGGAQVSLIVTNKANAGVLHIAQSYSIPSIIINKISLAGNELIEQLATHHPSLIVLAGFLLKVPLSIIEAFPGRLINLHPALLPAHGGKGMWGHHVHKAVVAAGDTQSGITIHYVDEAYDHGATILQVRCPVLPGNDADVLSTRVQALEHYWYPRAIEYLLTQAQQ